MRGLLWAFVMEVVKAAVGVLAALAIYRRLAGHLAALLRLLDRL